MRLSLDEWTPSCPPSLKAKEREIDGTLDGFGMRGGRPNHSAQFLSIDGRHPLDSEKRVTVTIFDWGMQSRPLFRRQPPNERSDEDSSDVVELSMLKHDDQSSAAISA